MKPNGADTHTNPHRQSPGWEDQTPPEGWQSPSAWEHTPEPFNFINLATAEIPPYERPWLITDWIPMLETTGLGGPGGEGKTLLAHMLATAAPLGASWLGLPVTQMKSALILCEDRDNDSLWRQRDINRLHNNLSLKTLAPAMLICPRRNNEHNYLAVFDREGLLHETTFFLQLLTELKKFARNDPLLTVLDTRADMFWGNQSDERHARMFVRKICDQIARETNGAVILIFQPSLTGMRDGTGTSGSVQWHAAFRAFLYLEPHRADKPEDDDHFRRTLTLMKANYADKNKIRDIRWKDGVFFLQEELDAAKPDYQRAAEHGQLKDAFRAAFAEWNKTSKHPLSPDPASRDYYAPKRLAPVWRLGPGKAKPKINNLETGLAQAMRELINAGEFHVEEVKLNGRSWVAIAK